MQRSRPQIFPFSRQRNDDCLNRQGDIAGGLRSKTPVVGSNGLEPSTSRLSGVRSNHLSYEPVLQPVVSNQPDIAANTLAYLRSFSRSEKLRWPFVVPSGQTVASATYRPPCAITVFPFVPTAARLGSGNLPLVETNRIELSTPCLQGRCSPS